MTRSTLATRRLLSERLERLRGRWVPPIDDLPLREALDRFDWPFDAGANCAHAYNCIDRWTGPYAEEACRHPEKSWHHDVIAFNKRFPTIGSFRRELHKQRPDLGLRLIGPKALAIYRQVFGVSYE